MRQPNFFIIGAPKCGTTSLAAWLSEHPNIYMSPIKEPNFFNTDLGRSKITRSEYEQLFRGASAEHEAVGEASTSYLFSQVAVTNIEKELPGARYIVMVRNPVDMAYSFHEELLSLGFEHIKDFATAWRLSEERAKGRKVTRWCHEPKLLDYKSVCRLGEQLQRLFDTVPRKRVLVIVLDDMKRNPRSEYLRVLDFLGVPDDGRQNFPIFNPAKSVRSPRFQRTIVALGRTASFIKRQLGIPVVKGAGVLQKVSTLNRKYRPRPPMPPELSAELSRYFVEDIRLLERLLGRDFSAWLEPPKGE